VQRFGRDIGAVWPADRPEFLVTSNLSEVRGIAKRLEDAAPIPVRRVKLATDTVVERKPQTMLADNLDLDDPVQMRSQVGCVEMRYRGARGL
jgi:hypothetical protein